MRPLLVLLERLWGPLGASLTALGASWGALGRVLRSSSGALGDVVGAREPLILKMSSWSMANTVKGKKRMATKTYHDKGTESARQTEKQ